MKRSPLIALVVAIVALLAGCLQDVKPASAPGPIAIKNARLAKLTPAQIKSGKLPTFNLPKRTVRTMQEIKSRPGAKAVLDDQGRVVGPIDPNPTFTVIENGKFISRPLTAKPVPAIVGGASTPTVVLVPNPANMGNSIDITRNRLFSSGSEDLNAGDINQMSRADCYDKAVLQAIATENPAMRSAIVHRNNADGTFDFFLKRSDGVPVAYRVDGIVGDRMGRPNPQTGAMWPVLLEKVFAKYRWDAIGTNGQQYVSYTIDLIDWGNPVEPLQALSCDFQFLRASDPNFGIAVDSALAQHLAMVVCTRGNAEYLISAHCYQLYDRYVKDGVVYYVLGNPWGGDNRWVAITEKQLQSDVSSVVQVTRYPKFAAIKGDFDGDGVVSASDFDLWWIAMGSVRGDGNFNPRVDQNGTGIIDASDFDLYSTNLGQNEWLPTVVAGPAGANGAGVMTILGGGTMLASPANTSTTLPATRPAGQPQTITGEGKVFGPGSIK